MDPLIPDLFRHSERGLLFKFFSGFDFSAYFLMKRVLWRHIAQQFQDNGNNILIIAPLQLADNGTTIGWQWGNNVMTKG